jgi:Flp pilus assembly pilin Flp
MLCRLANAFAIFLKSEDGLTKVEYAGMLAILVVGCIAVLLLQGKDNTFTIKFRDRREQTRGAIKDTQFMKVTATNKENSEAFTKPSTGSGPSDTLTSTKVEMDESATEEGEKTMSEDDARQALIGLLKAYPKAFPVSSQTIKGAHAVREGDYLEINSFRCNLRTRNFAYGTRLNGRFRVEKSGSLFQNENGEWTGKITRAANK